MLDAIRFVMSAVARRDYVQALSQCHIHNGRITGFNGNMALSSDIAVDIDVMPRADKFYAAINACVGTISLHMTPKGRLAIRAGAYKAYVDCVTDDDGRGFVEPAGEVVELGPKFMDGIEAIAPIMGVDASRPWSMGIKLQAGSMFATNNVIFIEYWHGAHIPVDVVIPASAIKELLRIGEPPIKVQVTPNSITFWFSETRWLQTSLLQGNSWPMGKMGEVLALARKNPEIEFPQEFFDSIATLQPFLAEAQTVYVSATGVATHRDEGIGATVDMVTGAPDLQAHGFKQMTMLREVATHIDWTNYPDPCHFRHSEHPMRGVVLGQRL